MKKDLLDNAVLTTLNDIITNPENLEYLAERITTIHNESLASEQPVKAIEKELLRVNKAIDNIMAAIEQGIVTNTTKERLQAYEKERLTLQEKLIDERIKEQKQISKATVIKYLTTAIQQDPALMIEYLVSAVYVHEDYLDIILKYGEQPPPTLYDGTDDTENPAGVSKLQRGVFITEQEYFCAKYSGKGTQIKGEEKIKDIISMPVKIYI